MKKHRLSLKSIFKPFIGCLVGYSCPYNITEEREVAGRCIDTTSREQLQYLHREAAKVADILTIAKRDLIELVGSRRADNLMRNRVYGFDYCVLADENDRSYANQIHNAFMSSIKDASVAGPWSIRLGGRVLNSWGNILNRSVIVVVLVSRAFLDNAPLAFCLNELRSLLDSKIKVIPVYIEKIKDAEYPANLKHLHHFQGLNAIDQSPEDIVGTLIRWSPQTSVMRHVNELINMINLKQDIFLRPEEYI